MDFWERLKLEIKRNNTTQEWLAKKIDVPFGTLRKWLSRQTMPNADQAVAMAAALGTTVEYLVTGEPPKTFSPSDNSLLELANTWKQVIVDLNDLDPIVASSWTKGIHSIAEDARLQRQAEVKNA